MNKSDFEIDTTWVMSTGHITSKDNNILTEFCHNSKSMHRDGAPLDSQEAIWVKSYRYGYYIQISIWANDILTDGLKDLVDSHKLSSYFIGLIYSCIIAGHRYLKLDCDANIIDTLPSFEW